MQNNKPVVFVDADSCPFKDVIEKICKDFEVPLYFVMNVNHYNDELSYGEPVMVDDGSQMVDMYIINHVKAFDVTITQDLSLAALLTPRRVYVLTPRGKQITEEQVDEIMWRKYVRQTSSPEDKLKGPKALTEEDRFRLEQSLKKILSNMKGI
ncbi:DUF188 domain-containing protein [Thalassobacillus sp. CUG 92003]|uniref:DUF188 domain-containing protein n=1 Tax=Thalassobacillus sp. CUG 92003 TaxID=2736641 RepID=UPI0015E65B4E|nr:DUF188 domain-containing protein [Thalassobacillus sp. CUG 92003]